MDFKLFSICENQRNQRETERTPADSADIHRKSILNFDIINLSTCSKQIGSLFNLLLYKLSYFQSFCIINFYNINPFVKAEISMLVLACNIGCCISN